MKANILLVEDDPTTRAYLTALLETVPARVGTADSMAAALSLAGHEPHDLWLVDAHLPDGSGVELLATLRARGLQTRALAHTAARDRSELDPLIRAGYAEVLLKPVDAGAWLGAIRRVLGLHAGDAAITVPAQTGGKLPVWDDEAAARALGGSSAHVAALREMFLVELPSQRDAIGGGDASARQAQLHRLRASCALVGAVRLGAAVEALQAAPDGVAELQGFADAAQDTLGYPASSAD